MGDGSDGRSQGNESANRATGLSRRKWLSLSAAGMAALAGCTGGGGGGGGGTTSGGTTGSGDGTTGAGGTSGSSGTSASGTPVEAEFTGFQGALPQDLNWNFYQPNFPGGVARNHWHKIRPQEMQYLEDWSYDTENQVEQMVFPDEGITWWNGDDLTAEAMYVQNEIGRLQNPSNSTVESNELVDDYTVEQTYKEQQNPTIVRREAALGTTITTKPSKYQQWVTRYQDATTQDKRNSITEELQNWKVSTQELIDEGLGNGPYEMVEANNQEMVFDLRTDHPWATEDQVQDYRIQTSGESSNLTIRQDEYDWGPGTPGDNYPSNLNTVVKFNSLQGSKVLFNNSSKHMKNRKFRRALANLINGQSIAQNRGGGFTQVTKNCGMGDSWAKEWLGEDFWNNLHEYPYQSNTERATTLLNEAGYSKQGGSWVGPDGNTVSLDVMIGNWQGFKTGARTVNSQLDSFGFNTSFQSMPWAAYKKRSWEQMEHDVSFYYHNNWANHPVSYYRPNYPGGMRLALPANFRNDIEGWLEEGREQSPLTGLPLEPTIPSEVGALEVSGSGETINIFETWDAINAAQSREETVKQLRKLARYWNYDLPHFHVFMWNNSWWGDTGNFDLPVDNDDIKLYGSREHALFRGMIKYKYEN